MMNGTLTADHGCMAAIKGDNSVKCKRFRTLLSISDQASAYEKLGKQIIQDLIEYMNDESTFPFPIVHIHTLDIKLKTHKQLWNVGPTLMAKTITMQQISH